MAFLVVTAARKPQTTQMRHGQRLGTGESAIEGGRRTSLRSRRDFERKQLANAGADVRFLRLFLNALQLTGPPPPAAGPPVVGAAAPRSQRRAPRPRRRFL